MREIFKIIKEHFILLLGTGLFTYGLFSFKSDYYEGVIFHSLYEKYSPSSTITCPIATYYYYDSTDLILLTVGVILIAIGLIKIRKKKDKN
ncbi:unnamed protein product [marine sediment metagenome]|uniref:Uncharacterized protein n=1 Tax=marine sediment metagenome TaxID=412755 RepID=X1Q656_9ZZZZ